jgi:DNA-binding PadR family transcriptional regulator
VSGALGEFEQLVLLAVVQLGADAHAGRLRERIERDAHRKVTRGALYATLDRLTAKGFVAWEVEGTTPERGGIPRRRFRLTPSGMDALRRSYAALRALARGIEGVLGGV